MANPIKRGESGSQVSSWNPTSSSTSTSGLISTIVPYGLTLQRTITQTYRTEMISNMSATATVLTVTCQHHFFVGQTITISGATPSIYNITGTIATVSQAGIGYNNSFTINTTATSGAGTYTGGGTVSSGSLAIPVPWVYAIIAGAGGSSGGGGSPSYGAGGGAGGIAWGWTVASPSCIVGLGSYAGLGSNSNYTRYGNIIAGGGTGYGGTGFLGAAGGGSSTSGVLIIGECQAALLYSQVQVRVVVIILTLQVLPHLEQMVFQVVVVELTIQLLVTLLVAMAVQV